MKIRLKNWGPVSEFEYDLSKSIIVTYGDNNIGKSYAMQIIYLFLKYLIEYSNRNARLYRTMYFYQGELKDRSNFVHDMVIGFARNTDVQLEDISEKLEEIFAHRLALDLYPIMEDAFENTFGTYESMLLQKPQITLEIEDKIHCTFDFELGNLSIKLKMKRKPTRLRKALSEFHKCRNGKDYFDIYVFENHVNTPIELVETELAKMQKEFAIEILKKVQSVYFLPASRSGIYAGMSSFGPIMAQLSQSRAYIRRGSIQIPSISEPISDYYMMLSEIYGDTKGHFSECAEEIENNVLKGEVVYNKKNRAIIYKPFASELQLEMRDTSSMVSEISPIVAFLKYIVERNTKAYIRRMIGEEAKPKAILFIEEPEAHLHPSNQIALMKAFVKLSKENIILIMASHSNYIFNQLNNLVLDRKISKELYLPVLLKKEGNESISYYMNIDELGVDDENFADVSTQLMEERDAIIEKIMEEKWGN